jgi:predicted Fe-Mo cluster-binding NifX family protein
MKNREDNKKSIRMAFAVNVSGRFEEKHFSNADKFLIYEWTNEEFFLLKEEVNIFKNFEEDQNRVSDKNCISIIDILKSSDVKILVSRQFGKNIQTVNHLFVPVIINSETPDEVVSIINKHIRWIEDELNRNPKEFKLFSINRGILKTDIRKEN